MFESLASSLNWPVSPLSLGLRINRNSGFAIQDLEHYRIAGVTNRGGGIIIKRTVTGSELTMREYQRISANQLMWCKVDTKNGAFGITKEEHVGCLASPNMCLADIDLNLIDPKFLQFFFQLPCVIDGITSASLGTTNRQYLKPQEFLDKVRLRLPPLTEQRRIVARIEELAAKINEACRLREQAITQLDALALSYLSRSFDYEFNCKLPFGWNWKLLNDLFSDDSNGMTTGPFGTLLQKSDIQSEGVPVLGISNIQANRFVMGFSDYVAPWKAEALSTYRLEAGDIVIARLGTVGRSCVIPAGLDPAPIMSTNLIRLRLRLSAFLPELLCRLFNGSRLIENHKDAECRGSSREFFTQKILRRLRIPTPPLGAQRRILAELHELEAQTDGLRKNQFHTATALNALMPSILDKAFSGEL